MIAGVSGWRAVAAAFFLIARAATAAEDPNGAARELAAATARFAGAGATVSAEWRNTSSLGTAEFNQIRGAFESALKQVGGRTGDSPNALEVRLTLSENLSQYLLVEEARKGADRQVWIAGWTKGQAVPSAPAGISLERRLVWEQNEPILDVAFPPNAMLLLTPSKIVLLGRQNERWAVRQSQPLNLKHPLPRDPRGRLRITGPRYQAQLPGTTCGGAIDPELTVECAASARPLVIESGSRALLLGHFTPARNYFDGRVVTQSGAAKTVPPFYTAAAIEDRGQTLWLAAMLDGRTLLFDSELNPLDPPYSLPAWGSDIAGIDARCGPATQVLATRPGESEGDAIQAWSVANRSAVPVTAPVDFPGPVTALWTSGGTGALAVAHDLTTGRYSAYVLTLVCGS